MRAYKGGNSIVLRVLGYNAIRREDGALQEVNSIDLIIVGLGLVLVLLVLLRR